MTETAYDTREAGLGALIWKAGWYPRWWKYREYIVMYSFAGAMFGFGLARLMRFDPTRTVLATITLAFLLGYEMYSRVRWLKGY